MAAPTSALLLLRRTAPRAASVLSQHTFRRHVTKSHFRPSPDREGEILWPLPPVPAGAYPGDFASSSSSSASDPPASLSAVFDSVVQIHCTHSEPDHLLPWQRTRESTSSSSGFVVDVPGLGRRILTNAHAVDYGSLALVQRRGEEMRRPARVEALGHECDLALLRVDDPAFWEGSAPLSFGPLPRQQDEVDVLGYPAGGDSLSVTSGVVSRAEMQEYVHAGTGLLALQIDAAINAGNSGGPVVDARRKVVGVAFQSLRNAENIGYVVPVTVVRHFLEDVRRHGRYTGFCSLGVRLDLLRNPVFRRSLGMEGDAAGVMVRAVDPTSPAGKTGLLRESDVIVAVDGIPVANDGKIPFRHGERVAVACYIQTKFQGDHVSLDLLRDGKRVTVDTPVSVRYQKVPAHWNNKSPPYLIVSGLVFMPLSVPFLRWRNAWGGYISNDISYLLGMMQGHAEEEGDQVVTLTQVLAHTENLGYDKYTDLHLIKYNEREVRSLEHLQAMIHDDEEQFMRFEFAGDVPLIVLERSSMEEMTQDVCRRHGIPHVMYPPEPTQDH